jgi:murein DD-endopeptidase MepM/ murein hydrolase activator NlpD
MAIYRDRRPGLVPVIVAFAAGAVTGGLLVISLTAPSVAAALADDCGEPEVEVRPAAAPPPAPAPKVPLPPASEAPKPESLPDAIALLRSRRLTLPVKDLDRKDLRSSFDEARSGGRRHEALDILSPRNTPVLAVEDGTIARLFTSKAGGITVYQFDPTSRFAYYYAHLQKYADGLKDGDRVKRGQVLGYVGTTGNAPPETPHLHFAIFKLGDDRKWWQGTALDPYAVLR